MVSFLFEFPNRNWKLKPFSVASVRHYPLEDLFNTLTIFPKRYKVAARVN